MLKAVFSTLASFLLLIVQALFLQSLYQWFMCATFSGLPHLSFSHIGGFLVMIRLVKGFRVSDGGGASMERIVELAFVELVWLTLLFGFGFVFYKMSGL